MHSTATSGLGRLNRRADRIGDLHAERATDADDVAQVAAGLLRIDVHGGNDPKPTTREELFCDRRPNRAKAHQHHPNLHHCRSEKEADYS